MTLSLTEVRFLAGESALYVGNKDARAFADEIVQVLRRPKRAAAMGALGRRRVEETVSWQSQAENQLRVYRQVTVS